MRSSTITTTGPKLIGFAKSRAFRCLWMLEEIGIPYQFIHSLPQSSQVLKYNPLGKVPIFVEEDGFVLYESGAIVTYLGDKYRDTSSDSDSNLLLVPRAGTKERGLYDQTMSVIQSELDSQGLWIHRKHEVMGEHFTYIPDAVTHAKKYFNKTNRVLIQQLKDNNNTNNSDSDSDGGGGPYLLGSNFTAVDIMYVHCLNWSKTIGWDNKWNDDKTIKQYMELCMTRSAYQKASSIKDEDHSSKL